ncbi:MAG: hypothetical protein C0602_04585 [Denitrovibrio sp.]|nr:MAG: hypothetical protein C0602_04585 [Denitrovibrio sp.]
MKDYRSDLTDIFMSAVSHAEPEELVRSRVFMDRDCLVIDSSFTCTPKKIFMFAFGKAAAGMAKGFMSVCKVDKGVVASNVISEFPENINVIKASHQMPDEGSLTAAEKMLELAEEADEKTLCVFLVSGGGSAILCSPAFGITLQDKMQTFSLLIRSGASIEDVNTVRRHISGVKGGRLLEAARPAHCVTLAISDVISGSPNAIASGPTFYDDSTWGDALEVIERYGLRDKLPERVISTVEKGYNRQLPDTMKKGSHEYNYFLIGTNLDGMQAAADKASEMGYKVRVYSQLVCDVSEAAEAMASSVGENLYSEKDLRPVCMIYGGEVTVNVRGSGKGGRCQQLALDYLLKDKPAHTFALCASTDGMDGPTDAAGAYADCEQDIEGAEAYLLDNDAYAFFKKNGALFKTGLTGTNINDLYIIIIPASQIKAGLQALAEERSYI